MVGVVYVAVVAPLPPVTFTPAAVCHCIPELIAVDAFNVRIAVPDLQISVTEELIVADEGNTVTATLADAEHIVVLLTAATA